MSVLPRKLEEGFKEKESNSIGKYIVIGGGIAGVCCAQEIARLKTDDSSIEVIIITATELLKESAGVMKITNHLEEVSVFERTADRFSMDNPRIRVIQGLVLSIDTTNKIVRLKDNDIISYEKLCICTGAQPKLIASHPNIIGLRDLQSVTEMTERLSGARKVLIVGNGGIALELVHSLSFCDVDWVIKDSFLGSSFFDASASAFVMPGLLERISASSSLAPAAANTTLELDVTDIKRTVVAVPINNFTDAIFDDEAIATGRSFAAATTSTTAAATVANTTTSRFADIAIQENQRDLRHQGAALGPEWLTKSKLLDNLPSELKKSPGSLNIHYLQDITAIREGLNGIWKITDKYSNDSSDLNGHIMSNVEAAQSINAIENTFEDTLHPYPLYVMTSKNIIIGCDFIVSATGVVPCIDFLSSEFLRSDEASNNRSLSPSLFSSPEPSSVRTVDLSSTIGVPTSINSKKRKLKNMLDQREQGALTVNELMETSVRDVYAAGDCCCYPNASSNSMASDTSNSITTGRHWFQMRLWTQARSMGLYAAQVG